MHEHRNVTLRYEHHRAEAARLRAEAIDELVRALGRQLRSVLARGRRPAAAATDPRRARPRPSLARAAS